MSDLDKESEEECNVIEEEVAVQPPTKSDVVQALGVLQTCSLFWDEMGDEMRRNQFLLRLSSYRLFLEQFSAQPKCLY